MSEQRDMRWVRRGILAGVVLLGWVFIAWQNRFHVAAPMAFVSLGWLAVVATVYNLWRVGAAATGELPEDDRDDSTFAKPMGAKGELEREKRTLLKAIKEAEFDHEMGKLSKADVDDMIRTYRARAIDVIKELDKLEAGAGSVREQIEREVKARLEMEKAEKVQRKPKRSAKSASGGAKPSKVAAPAKGAATAAKKRAPVAPPPDGEDDDDDEVDVGAAAPADDDDRAAAAAHDTVGAAVAADAESTEESQEASR